MLNPMVCGAHPLKRMPLKHNSFIWVGGNVGKELRKPNCTPPVLWLCSIAVQCAFRWYHVLFNMDICRFPQCAGSICRNLIILYELFPSKPLASGTTKCQIYQKICGTTQSSKFPDILIIDFLWYNTMLDLHTRISFQPQKLSTPSPNSETYFMRLGKQSICCSTVPISLTTRATTIGIGTH